MNIEPFQQGQLDALCGLYATVNAVQICQGALSKQAALELFEELVDYLEHWDKASDERMYLGMSSLELVRALKATQEHYPITWKRPFIRKTPQLDHLWSKLSDFLNEPGRCVILDITDRYGQGHWTVLYRITESVLHLCDSCGRQRINRQHCTTQSREPNTFTITAYNCFFIQLQED